MAEFYPLLFGRGFSLPQLLFFLLLLLTLVHAPTTAPPGALRAALPLHPPAGFFSPPGSIAVRRAVNIYYQ